ncbi:hypothetical protein MIT9_P0547 [Methylomarinovum caldicuralii]|uniref:Cupin 2 conserved barrel domain-containing protein n=1 Tax=Methylomarinovum caldicuralii TaxID=438856 RepID=A0AAU9C513_9GAMM|nr:cupin domain-containing protein [Methylomarinovum caldicuralii]BCX80969.1 hypothetical protein MIT9_P0547 [Methylomarinovum caldicuralii]
MMKRILTLASLALLIATTAWAAGMPQRDVLLARPVTLPDTHIVTRVIRVTFPPGFRTPEHIHKGPGPRYVLSGEIRIIDKEGTKIYRQGQVFWETGKPMVAENAAGETVLLIFEMAPEKQAESTPRRRKIVIRPQR